MLRLVNDDSIFANIQKPLYVYRAVVFGLYSFFLQRSIHNVAYHLLPDSKTGAGGGYHGVRLQRLQAQILTLQRHTFGHFAGIPHLLHCARGDHPASLLRSLGKLHSHFQLLSSGH